MSLADKQVGAGCLNVTVAAGVLHLYSRHNLLAIPAVLLKLLNILFMAVVWVLLGAIRDCKLNDSITVSSFLLLQHCASKTVWKDRVEANKLR